MGEGSDIFWDDLGYRSNTFRGAGKGVENLSGTEEFRTAVGARMSTMKSKTCKAFGNCQRPKGIREPPATFYHMRRQGGYMSQSS